MTNRAIVPTQVNDKSNFKLTAAPTAFAIGESKSGVEAVTMPDKQTYLDRLRNYIPIEIIGFFVFVDSAVPAVSDPSAGLDVNDFVAVAALVIGLIATVIYTRVSAESNGVKHWRLTACISVFAFLVWIYAIGAKGLEVLSIEEVPSVSALLIASFTLFSGLVVPTATSDDEPPSTAADA